MYVQEFPTHLVSPAYSKLYRYRFDFSILLHVIHQVYYVTITSGCWVHKVSKTQLDAIRRI